VLVTWDSAVNLLGCDAFYCSRDLDGKFTGEYQTLQRTGAQTVFQAVDSPAGPGTLTWRVTAFRATDATSVNWSTSNAVTLP
jgi:hypothetical protein